jgi:hypothetical protein
MIPSMFLYMPVDCCIHDLHQLSFHPVQTFKSVLVKVHCVLTCRCYPDVLIGSIELLFIAFAST